jgi:hypothetical protein
MKDLFNFNGNTESLLNDSPSLMFLYRGFIRPVLRKAVNDPNEEWDEYLMAIVDYIFGYQERRK